MFLFQKVRFLQHFPQNFCFLCLIFVRFSQQFPPKIFPAGHLLKNQTWGICTTHSQKRWVNAGFRPKIFTVFAPWKTAVFAAKTDFHFIFSEIKNSYAKKIAVFVAKTNFHCIFRNKKFRFRKSAVFAEFHEFLSFTKKIILASSFRISSQKTAFFEAKTDFHLICFWNKKFICRKKCCFRRIS